METQEFLVFSDVNFRLMPSSVNIRNILISVSEIYKYVYEIN